MYAYCFQISNISSVELLNDYILYTEFEILAVYNAELQKQQKKDLSHDFQCILRNLIYYTIKVGAAAALTGDNNKEKVNTEFK